jgi:DNA-directed RNA polymerase specialized sigma24 family protein
VYENLARFRGNASFPAWATRIAVNEAIALTDLAGRHHGAR